MSTIHSIFCVEKKIKIDVGQGGVFLNFWSGVPDTMQRLGRFLQETRGFPLVVAHEHEKTDEMWECKDFEDTEDGA